MSNAVDLIKKIQKREKLAKNKKNEMRRSDLGNISGGGISYHGQDVNITLIGTGNGSRIQCGSNVEIMEK